MRGGSECGAARDRRGDGRGARADGAVAFGCLTIRATEAHPGRLDDRACPRGAELRAVAAAYRARRVRRVVPGTPSAAARLRAASGGAGAGRAAQPRQRFVIGTRWSRPKEAAAPYGRRADAPPNA